MLYEICHYDCPICACVCVCVSCSVVSDFLPTHIAHQAPLPMEFSRQEYWSGLSFPFTGDLPYPGITYRSSALQLLGKPGIFLFYLCKNKLNLKIILIF